MSLGLILGGASLVSGLLGASAASKAAKEQAKMAEENARLTEEMAQYNAGIADSKSRQAIQNSLYDAGFAELEMMADIFVLDYQANVKANQAIYEEQMAEQVAIDGGINQIRKRKQDLKNLASTEAAAAGAGAVASGTVLELLVESVKNMEIDALEIGRLATIEQNQRMQSAYVYKTESELLQKRADMREVFGGMQIEGIKREGELLSQDYKTEAERLRRYGKIDAQNYMSQASSARAQGKAAAYSSVGSSIGSAVNIYKSF